MRAVGHDETDGPVTFAAADRQRWPEVTKAIALALIFLNHCVELVYGGGRIGNPHPQWGTFSQRWHELRPFPASEPWRLVATVFRWVGWLGDQAVGPFIIVSGFGLAWSALHRPETTGSFYRRRLARLYPLWWATLAAFLVLSLVSASRALSLTDGSFWWSVIGMRFTPGTIYYGIGAWWYFTLAVQLYLVFPYLWRWMQRLGPARSLLFVAVPAFAIRLVGLLVLDEYLDVWSRGAIFLSRLPEFVIGVAFAQALRPSGVPAARLDRRLRGPVATVGYVALFIGAGVLALTLAGMAVAPALFAISICGLVYAACGGAARATRGRGVLEWVGRHSFALYLVHHPIVSKLVKADQMGPRLVAELLASVVATAVVAVLLETGIGWLTRVVTTLRRPSGQTPPPASTSTASGRP